MNTSKTWLWIVIIVVLAVIAFTAWRYGFFSPVVKEPVPLSDGDTTTDITGDLNAVDLGDPDADLKPLDADLNQL